MHLAQDNDVVHTFTPDRSDQPFGASPDSMSVASKIEFPTGARAMEFKTRFARAYKVLWA
jgi:hypothetical protein